MYDVQIIGAGPVGCIAAREAARKNLSVAVFEEHSEVGARLKCSGLLSKKGLDSLGVNYRKAILNRIHGARVYSPTLDEMRIICRDVKAFVIDRKEFDARCAEEAEECGAKLLLGRKARKNDVKSKLLVGADGALSQVANWFDFPKTSEFAFCYQADFQNAAVDESRVVSIFLSNASFPGFFGWSIPLNESDVRVGVGVFRDVRKSYSLSAKQCFDNFIKTHPIIPKIIKRSKQVNILSAIIPLSVRKRTAKGNVLLVGDAAGQVKATTGGGIIFGGSCAKVAGRLSPAIIRSGNAAGYETAWRKEFGRDLAMHHRLRKVYNSLSDRQIESYFALAKKLGAESFLAEHGDMDSPTIIMDAASTALPLGALFSRLFTRMLC
jgi:digeranylgeranylglycerophospholipid reductase